MLLSSIETVMSDKLLYFIPTISLLIFSGCGLLGNDEKKVQTISDSTIEKVCDEISRTFCENATTCGCNKIYIFPDNCSIRIRESCRKKYEDYLKSQDIADIRLSGNLLTNCIDTINSYAGKCILPPEPVYSLECSVFISLAKTGEKCSNLLCDDGSGICNEKNICQSLPQKGEGCYKGLCQRPYVCNSLNICAEPIEKNFSCNIDSECKKGLICINGICSEIASDNYFNTCESDSECHFGAKCISSEEKTCLQLKAEGTKCTHSEECMAKLYCDENEKLCKPLPGTGKSCAGGIMCNNDSGCDISENICKESPALGEPCLFNLYGQVVCKEGLLCTEGLCQNPPGPGQRCGQNSKGLYECGNNLGCFFMENGENICKEKVKTGEKCTNDSNCAYTDFCDYNTNKCVPKLPEGYPCKMGNECLSGLVCDFKSKDSDPICLKPPKEGEECYISCAENLYCAIADNSKKCIPPICTAIITY